MWVPVHGAPRMHGRTWRCWLVGLVMQRRQPGVRQRARGTEALARIKPACMHASQQQQQAHVYNGQAVLLSISDCLVTRRERGSPSIIREREDALQ